MSETIQDKYREDILSESRKKLPAPIAGIGGTGSFSYRNALTLAYD